MSRSLGVIALGLSLLGTFGACGGDDGVSIDDLPAYVLDVQCSVAVECKNAASEATCKSSFQFGDKQSETIIADVKAGVIKYDPAKAKACFDARRADGCTFQGTHATDNDPCSTYLTGTVAVGGACFEDLECVDRGNCNLTDTSCDTSTTCCPGTCGAGTPSTEVALGGACANTSDCPINGYCKGKTSTAMGVCTAVVNGTGTACDDVFACANSLICNLTTQTSGTCYQPGAEGAACDPNFFVPDFACADQRDYCDPTSMKCTARVGVGATCSDTILCQGLAECIATKCVAQPTAGEACNSMDGPTCSGGLNCTNSICTLDPTGTSCR